LLHYASERESRQPYTGFFSFKSRGVWHMIRFTRPKFGVTHPNISTLDWKSPKFCPFHVFRAALASVSCSGGSTGRVTRDLDKILGSLEDWQRDASRAHGLGEELGPHPHPADQQHHRVTHYVQRPLHVAQGHRCPRLPRGGPCVVVHRRLE
jgi:hypothetical protein